MENTATYRKFVRSNAAPYTDKKRMILARSGKALPDGSFPILTRQDLANAISSYGRAKNKRLAKNHIINRAREMHLIRILPENWKKKIIQ